MSEPTPPTAHHPAHHQAGPPLDIPPLDILPLDADFSVPSPTSGPESFVPLPPGPTPAPSTADTPPGQDRLPSADLCDWYGADLADYCRLWLPDPDSAARAVGDVLAWARHHGAHLSQPHRIRAWLYALMRVRCLTDTEHSPSTGPSTGPFPAVSGEQAPQAQLALDALAALDRDDRELVELTLRHQLDHDDVAAILGRPPAEVAHAAQAAIDLAQAWANAVHLTRTGHPICPEAAPIAEAWDIGRRRETRTKLRMHIGRCPTCSKAVHMRTSMESLLAELPPITLTRQQRERILHDQPLAAAMSVELDSSGFPRQPDALQPGLPAEEAPLLAADLRAANDVDFWAETERDEDARLWRRPARPAADEVSAPPSSSPAGDVAPSGAPDSAGARPTLKRTLPTRSPDGLRPLVPVVRVSGIIAVAVTAVIAAGAAWSALQPAQPSATVAPVAAPATITLLGSDPPLLDPLADDPPVDPPADQPTTGPTSAPTTGKPTHRPTQAPASRSARPTGHPAKAAPNSQPDSTRTRPTRNGGTQDPPRPSSRPTVSNTVRKLPKPPSPTASLSPSSLALGSGRSASFALQCTGTCQVTGGSGSNGIAVSGVRVSVSAPQSRPGCTLTTEYGTASISWGGSVTGDGRTSAGTTSGGGTLTLSVSWTVEADKGTWIPTGSVGHVGDRQGYWSNCRNG
ncbi:hypothetical protein ACWDRB_47525 [Nonomuraea sp. NPDC003707]